MWMRRSWVSVSFIVCITACGDSALPQVADGPPLDSSTPLVVELQLLAGDPNGPGNLDGVGAAARFSEPRDVAVDGAGNVYVADQANASIRKITSAGVVTTFVGAKAPGSEDGAGAAERLLSPSGLAVDGAGNLYVADQLNHTIRKITDTGVVTTLAGAAGMSGSQDGAGATARFNFPIDVAVDGSGNVYVADQGNQTIRKITPGGVVSTLAGSADMSGFEDGTGAEARFADPGALAIDSAGVLYVASRGPGIRRVTAAGVVTTLARDHGINSSAGVAVDAVGNLYVADSGNYVIRKITPAEEVTTLAGAAGVSGSVDGTGAVARFDGLSGLARGSDGTLYVADVAVHTIRAVSPSGNVTTLAGAASLYGGLDGTGAAARFTKPSGVAVDAAGNAYVADASNRVVRKVTPAGVVTTLAGVTDMFGAADGAGPLARFFSPNGAAVDGAGNIYIVDGNGTVRKVTAEGITTTLAGTARMHGNADGTGAEARFGLPFGVAFDRAGTAYVTDLGASTLRKVTPEGVVTTLAGTAGVVGRADGTGPAASFDVPLGVAVDRNDNIYIADLNNHAIRKVTAAGVVTTLAGTPGLAGDADGTGASARFTAPVGVAVDDRGNIYVAELSASIRKVTPEGVTSTIAGKSGVKGITLGTAPRFSAPRAIAISGDSLLIADAHAILILRHGAQ
jgi:sugar lactone lactonase YvrE